MKKTIIWAGLALLSSLLLSQDKVIEATDVQALRAMEKRYRHSFEVGHKQAVKLAKQWDRPVRRDRPAFELQIINGRGMPQYYSTVNLNAAIAASTDQIWPGGAAGLNLSGMGMTVGEWDAGGVILSPEHVEYAGRGTQIDGPIATHYHSVHVAGTLIASGIDPKAKGMAWQAHLDAYDWTFDDSEMANAASAGLLLSNHSYGFTRGWYYYFSASSWMWFGDVSVSTTEDYLFGFYSTEAKEWDSIAYAAPYYLIVKAAGNDRNDVGGQPHLYYNGSGWVASTDPRDPDGPYDCLGEQAVAKNILTVGAVHDDGQTMASFSSWGPADDGRIKPDICANGYALYSTSNAGPNSYMSLSGTSMASPSACGSLLLLQQHYRNIFGSFCRAATLKGLALHCANDVGPVGPDYQYGWGMLNCARIAQVISSGRNSIGEHTLNNGGVYIANVVLDRPSSLRVTICWTDLPGTPPPAAVDPPDKMLVNDLDLRISGNNTVYFPWKLDPAAPSVLATTGDNDTDNVEQVIVPNASPGSYTITITHKGTLTGGAQDFSLIISDNFGPVAPSGLTAYSYKAQVKLSWQDNSGDETGFEVQRNSDGSFLTIAMLKPDATSYTDQVDLRSNHIYRVRALSDSGYSAFSNQVSITAGSDSDFKCGMLGAEFLLFFLLLALRGSLKIFACFSMRK